MLSATTCERNYHERLLYCQSKSAKSQKVPNFPAHRFAALEKFTWVGTKSAISNFQLSDAANWGQVSRRAEGIYDIRR